MERGSHSITSQYKNNNKQKKTRNTNTSKRIINMKKGRCSHSTYFDPVQRAKHYKRRIISEQRLYNVKNKVSGGAPFALHTEADEEEEGRRQRFYHPSKRRNRASPGMSPSSSSSLTRKNVEAFNNRGAVSPSSSSSKGAGSYAPSIGSLDRRSGGTLSCSPSVVSTELGGRCASQYELERLRSLERELKIEEKKRDEARAELSMLQEREEGGGGGASKQDRFMLS